MAQSIVTLRVDTTNATAALQGVQNKTNKLEKAFGGLRTAIAGIGVTVLAKQAIQTSTNFDKLNLRLGLLTKATGDFDKAQKIATDGQKLFGLSATEALEGVTNITARLKPLGTSLEDIRTTFIGFNTAAKLGGASSQEASAAFRQLAQALGSGRLAGDEFRSVSEQIPLVLKPLAEELGVTTGELKQLAADGKLTSDVVIRALSKLAKEGGEDLKAILENDPTQVFKNLQNETENLSRAIGDLLTPAVIPAVKGLTELTKAAVDFVNSPIGKASLIIGGIALAAQGLPVLLTAVSVALGKIAVAGGLAAIALNAIPFVAIATGATLLTAALIKANDKQKEFNNLVNAGDEQSVTDALENQKIKVKELQDRYDGLNAQQKKRSGNLKKELDEAKRVERMLQGRANSLESDKKIEEAQNKIVALKKKDLEVTRLTKEEREKHKKIAKDEADRIKKEEERKKKAFADFITKQEQSGELLQAAIDGNTKEVELQHDINNAVAIHGEHNRQKITDILTANQGLKDQKTEIDKNAEAAEELKGKFAAMGQEIEDGIVQNLTDAVMGTKTLAEAAINVLDRMKRKLIELAIQKAFAGIGGPIGGFLGSLFGRASGGPVSANQPYMVGERGREMFVPSTSGKIIPNNQLGGGVTNVINVSVDASGTEAQGDEATSSQLGKLIGLAVQQELVKQSRAGGLLSKA